MKCLAILAFGMLLISCRDEAPDSVVAKSISPKNTIFRIDSGNIAVLPAAIAGYRELDNYLKKFKKPVQRFSVSASRSSVVVGEKGLKVMVIAEDLETGDGSKLLDKIDVELLELQTPGDMLRQGITTLSDGHMLESGGCYFISMRSGGKQLKLKDGRSLSLVFPKMPKKGMRLYEGVANAAGDFNWRVPGRSGLSGSSLTRHVADSIEVRQEIAKYKDTILEKIGMRPDTKERNAGIEKYRQYQPVEVRIINGTYYFSGRVRDTFNRWYLRSKAAGVSRIMQDAAGAMQIFTLGWYNLGRWADEQTIEEATNMARQNAHVIEAFIIYKDLNSVVRRRLVAADSSMLLVESRGEDRTIKIIAFSLRNGKPYTYSETMKISERKMIRLDMRPVSDDEFERMITTE